MPAEELSPGFLSGSGGGVGFGVWGVGNFGSGFILGPCPRRGGSSGHGSALTRAGAVEMHGRPRPLMQRACAILDRRLRAATRRRHLGLAPSPDPPWGQLVEKEVEHMPAEGYPQKLQRWHVNQDLAAVRKDAIDWIWKDHHCIWINNCVGHENYKIFLVFVLYDVVASFYALILIIGSVLHSIPKDEQSGSDSSRTSIVTFT